MDRAYRNSTRFLGALVCAFGTIIVISTVARGGGPLSLGVVVGVGFMVWGAGRVYLASQR